MDLQYRPRQFHLEFTCARRHATNAVPTSLRKQKAGRLHPCGCSGWHRLWLLIGPIGSPVVVDWVNWLAILRQIRKLWDGVIDVDADAGGPGVGTRR
eukprot:355829-Chlamydomonas_euryale.AAC.2